MTRNQKIALGCGGAGCLGLIVAVIAGGLIYYFVSRQAASYRAAARNYNFNVNRNSNSTSNSDANDNSSNSNSSSSSSPASSLSDDEKHKLFQAAAMTRDTELIKRVNIEIGIWEADGVPGDVYRDFIVAHAAWAFRNMEFIQTINTPEKAKAYVDEHLE
jgi:hypothetical protein